MKAMKNILSIAVAAAVVAPSVQAEEWDASVYGSIRLALEAVDLDEESGNVGDYIDFRDGYSRFGAVLSRKLDEETTLSFKYELGLDSANIEVSRPDSSEDERHFHAKVSNKTYGDFYVGQDWSPVYLHTNGHLDYFNSFYSGFYGPLAFRNTTETIGYDSPNLGGFTFGVAYSELNQNDEQVQVAATYKVGGFGIHAGYSENNTSSDREVAAFALTYSTGPWYFAAYVNEDDANGRDSRNDVDLFASYTHGKHTWSGLIGDNEDSGDETIQLGWAYQYSDDWRFFAEYYYEEEGTAVTQQPGDLFFRGGDFNSSGGQVLTAGVRYDFKLL